MKRFQSDYNDDMPATRCRLLSFSVHDGYQNMAIDDVLLQSAETGRRSLRFYGWREPTLSLGYFQKADDRLLDPLLTECAWVRRASGGGAIMHHHELTYCLALPAELATRKAGSWLCRVHDAIRSTLSTYGVAASGVSCGEDKKLGSFLCFQHQTPADLLIGGHKIVGSAQRKRRGAVMQHGSILLQRSPLAPVLPGVGELAQVQIDAFDLATRLAATLQAETGWQFDPDELDAGELSRVPDVVRDTFAADEWNHRR